LASSSTLAAPVFGASAKLNIPGSTSLGAPSSLAPLSSANVPSAALGSTSFASLAHSSGNSPGKDKEVTNLLKTDTKIINTAKTDKTSDIDSLKKKLAMMERETSRLREMHKLRLKKLETKQRAQEERSKRDAEIQRVSTFKLQRKDPKTPFHNYRNHIASLLYHNIRQDEEDARTVYVRNLHPKIKEQQLRDHFSVFGAIKRIVLPQDAHAIGNNRGFTFITFASKEPVEVACSLDGTLFHERSIKVVPKTNMMGKIRPQHLVH